LIICKVGAGWLNFKKKVSWVLNQSCNKSTH
jgi:hypothetical protein